ncbi:hypothetical protein CkaCkLH20_08067 [Colletotrichum karsti]|uniref:Chromatin modification-related protein EAF3 n=1 Tax=Colletotrichum karsti TaxID=1095194 RepID=A0A9P6I1G4_9PEZI|nr:uncharacterized protein CkaCkLH20_08067 [Colletotrichum karsti]KAF9874504.1 hypothetical protein CkaCkLH20_08067 [Colletotrichum karsti]
MAPARQQPPQPFAKDEKVLCFHGEMLYEAKILEIQQAESGEGFQYRIHYKGWKNTWDDWVSIDRIRKFTEENKELANQLQAQMRDLRQKSSAKAPKKGLRANGTDSLRGSEERTAGVAASGRGPRRARDFDLEQHYTSISMATWIGDYIGNWDASCVSYPGDNHYGWESPTNQLYLNDDERCLRDPSPVPQGFAQGSYGFAAARRQQSPVYRYRDCTPYPSEDASAWANEENSVEYDEEEDSDPADPPFPHCYDEDGEPWANNDNDLGHDEADESNAAESLFRHCHDDADAPCRHCYEDEDGKVWLYDEERFDDDEIERRHDEFQQLWSNVSWERSARDQEDAPISPTNTIGRAPSVVSDWSYTSDSTASSVEFLWESKKNSDASAFTDISSSDTSEPDSLISLDSLQDPAAQTSMAEQHRCGRMDSENRSNKRKRDEEDDDEIVFLFEFQRSVRSRHY